MKKLFVLAFVLLVSVTVNAQTAVEKYFKKYEDNPDFSTVVVHPKMFSMITKATGDKDLKDLEVLKDIKGLTVLSTEQTPLKYYKEASQRIPLKEYDELVKVSDKGEKVNIFTKASKDESIVKEVLILVGEAKNFTLVSFVGNIKLEDLTKLAEKIDIKGAEHLDKVK